MHRKFLNARSPLRLLEKGLHGGLGRGNLGLLLAGHGVGKTPFLVGVALDDLLRGERALHVALDQTVSHVRAYYDTVFDELAATTHLEDAARVHLDVDRRRSIRAYPANGFAPAKLREALKFEAEAGPPPALVVLEGLPLEQASRDEVEDLRALARETDAEMWLSVACAEERVRELPPRVRRLADLFAVVLALEPGSGTVTLRALKD
ncbi:MAG TPA: hypothetical protein VLA62_04895, partial [Solirubrobacterales bacterium]|nr:hypothetical protein [Solirubrobacterales bacterium]